MYVEIYTIKWTVRSEQFYAVHEAPAWHFANSLHLSTTVSLQFCSVDYRDHKQPNMQAVCQWIVLQIEFEMWI